MTVSILEASYTDHPDMTTIVDVYKSTKDALAAALKLIQEDMDSMGEDEEITCEQTCPSEWKLNYKGSLNDWFVTVYNPK